MPGDEIAAGEGDGSRLVASQADREQVLDALKAAFVQGRLTKAEFDHRVGQALASYAELDALTADIPAGRTQTLTTESARKSHNRKLIQRGTAAGASASMAFTAALVTEAGGSPVRRVGRSCPWSAPSWPYCSPGFSRFFHGSLRRAPTDGFRKGRHLAQAQEHRSA